MAILSWNSQSYLEIPTINQLNSLAGQSTKTMKTSLPALPVNILPIYYPSLAQPDPSAQAQTNITHGSACKIVTISSFLHFLISHFLISRSCF